MILEDEARVHRLSKDPLAADEDGDEEVSDSVVVVVLVDSQVGDPDAVGVADIESIDKHVMVR